MEIKAFGEKSVLIQFENKIDLTIHREIKCLYKALLKASIHGLLSIIPAYTSITLIFDQKILDLEEIKGKINALDIDTQKSEPTKIVKIPICYHPSLGIDIEEVAIAKGISVEEIIQLHTQQTYTVYMLGFSPGFMYLGGLNPQLFTPRKKTPRLKIEAGAVGLADQQTGIYPSATPGGWQIIGQTPIPIFQLNQKPLVQMGDEIRFTSIDIDTFHQLKEEL